MTRSEAQIKATVRDVETTGPPEGPKDRACSRAEAIGRGLSGAGVALASEEVTEVDRMCKAFEADFRPSDEIGRLLIRRAATCFVRMERGVLQETAALSRRVLAARAEAESNGEDPIEAGHRAMFDPSREACLARKYEASAERGFFRAIKEFRQREREAKAPSPAKSEAAAIRKQVDQLASFFPAEVKPPVAARPAPAPPSIPVPRALKPAPARVKTVFPAWNPVFKGSVDVPITIGLAP